MPVDRAPTRQALPATQTPPAPLPGFWGRLAALFSRRDLVEAALVAAAFLLYFWVRGAVIDRPDAAYWHARDVINVQRALGFFWEDDMNNWIKDREFWAQLMNVAYFYLHFPLIIVFGIWMYYFRRGKYTLARDSFLASGAIALVIYALYPVAPPRALPELSERFDPNAPAYVKGFLDTVQHYLGYAYDSQSTHAFVNPYAAMPSLHFGWDLLLGIAIVRAFAGSRWIWIAAPIGVFLPVLQIFSITLTANHFFLDAAAGGVVALAGLALAVALRRWVYPGLRQWAQGLQSPAARRWLLAEESSRTQEQ